MRIAVIGRGLIGSAAARHLAEAGHEVVLIGPGEPADYATHSGVFGSHYDEGRITRGLDRMPFWSAVSRASIARYRALEAATQVPFYSEVGTLMAGPEGTAGVSDVGDVAQQSGITCERFDRASLAARFPFFDFPSDTIGYFEAQNAGYISPRNLVRAQGIAVEAAGGQIVDAEVTGFEEIASGVTIDVAGDRFKADRVLIAAGGFTNGLLGDALPLKVYARTVALFEIDTAEATRLAAQPSLIYLGPNGEDPYLLPPIRYPDGRTYLKLGGDVVDRDLTTQEARQNWFRAGGSVEVGVMLTDHIRARMPELEIRSTHIRPCVTTYTPTDLPIIDLLSGRVAVAVGGNGKGAKNSDELGRLGAEAVLGDVRPDLALAASMVA
ncbi:FAD-binding oxidoreductase [Cognatishimia sp. MH4019]|uniref:NAD(P)/FAD-dependent oxidoreductase n=1 Tax=Cognatishimia sp. MH4019 TaxID=2854030 RepID=UPI001CD35BCF|nr:FAD-dependent oxidoreductase [Cognatishimia sp. MH4019]